MSSICWWHTTHRVMGQSAWGLKNKSQKDTKFLLRTERTDSVALKMLLLSREQAQWWRALPCFSEEPGSVPHGSRAVSSCLEGHFLLLFSAGTSHHTVHIQHPAKYSEHRNKVFKDQINILVKFKERFIRVVRELINITSKNSQHTSILLLRVNSSNFMLGTQKNKLDGKFTQFSWISPVKPI